ncbi:MAG: SUMF1/EgtB/PvdO family nonheme iron enzyme [Deltaproteobacteria bacterium]|nr:SUMF1/EgtB/PvdO family nonheme iron enzyme [Deltaproteobacteria bacterium]
MSIAGVKPSANLTWFQAQQACANAGKRLLRNGEWQVAAAGTPDPGAADDDSTTCNTTNDGFPANDPVNTGSRSACVSRWGAFDMVGNVWEWVEDWVPLSTGVCVSELFSGTGDVNCLMGASTTAGPGALVRGGDFSIDAGSGVFAVVGLDQPSVAAFGIGFRCAR